MEALKQTESVGVTLNAEKCEIGRKSIIKDKGITADLEKTSAIKEMQSLTNVPEPAGKILAEAG